MAQLTHQRYVAEMNKKNISLFVMLTAFVAILSAGCRTMEGAGEDIERAGEKIQDNAK